MDADLFIVLAVFVVAFAALALAEAPIALSILSAAVMGIVVTNGFENAQRVLGSVFYTATAKYALFVIPMYVLLGAVLANAGIGERIYRSVHRVVRWLPGGLAATSVGATSLFSGISGSSAADVATFGRVSVNEMSRHGYSKSYAAAVVAAAGTFANLIPPSLAIVIYGLIAEESIGRLIMAALVPGLLSALALVLFVVMRAMLSGPDGGRGARSVAPAPVLPAAAAVTRPPSAWVDLVGAGYAVVIFLIVVGGLYGGYFTATEAGAIGAFAGLVIMFLSRPTSGLTRRRILGTSLRETSEVTSMIFLLLVGGALLAYLVASSGLARDLAEWILALPVPPKVTIAIILLLVLPLGMLLDGLSILLIVVPLVAPVVTELGFDGVWFGILMLKVVEIGLITPPVGLNVFIISGIAKVPTAAVFKDIRAFIALDLAITASFFAFPSIVLWLPAAAGYPA
jgi:C4-dicarboxylate transporter DctM subunit